MTQTTHGVEPVRAHGGLRRLRRGDLQSPKELSASVLGKANFQSVLQVEIERALQDDLTLLVAGIRIRPLPGHDQTALAGRQLPDELLERIRSVHENIKVVVVSAEELLLLLPSVRRRPDGEAAVNHLIEVLTPPLVVDGLDHHLSPMIGAAMLGHESPSAELLVDGANLALSECDESNPAMMFHPYQRVRQERRADLQSDLRAAVLDDQIKAALQPAFNLESGELVALEAFARWNRAGKGPVPPFEFVALAKDAGVGHLLTRQVLEQSVDGISRYQSENPDTFRPVTLWLNVSPDDVSHPEFPRLIIDAIDQNEDITIGLELSPSPDAEARDIHRSLKRLVSRGARVAIGDFGIGNANLTVLQQLPYDAVKLDRALIRQIAGNSDAANLVGALIEMADLLKLETTAQGIETESQLDIVTELGCAISQGYYHAEPTSTNEELHQWFTR
ncbi:MAG: EAL domain-containing protein [Actinomycetota bacterium]